ncbi:MAG: response regulator [Pseudomonadota bacterium]
MDQVQRKCLIVDDSSVIRNVAERIFDSMGFEVVHAESGQQAREKCMNGAPELILVDWRLPEEDSTDLVRDLRSMGSDTSRPTIVYLTSEMDVASMTRAKRAGADAFFMKPFDRASLSTKMRELGLAA